MGLDPQHMEAVGGALPGAVFFALVHLAALVEL